MSFKADGMFLSKSAPIKTKLVLTLYCIAVIHFLTTRTKDKTAFETLFYEQKSYLGFKMWICSSTNSSRELKYYLFEICRIQARKYFTLKTVKTLSYLNLRNLLL